MEAIDLAWLCTGPRREMLPWVPTATGLFAASLGGGWRGRHLPALPSARRPIHNTSELRPKVVRTFGNFRWPSETPLQLRSIDLDPRKPIPQLTTGPLAMRPSQPSRSRCSGLGPDVGRPPLNGQFAGKVHKDGAVTLAHRLRCLSHGSYLEHVVDVSAELRLGLLEVGQVFVL